jgi:hypothetical protein
MDLRLRMDLCTCRARLTITPLCFTGESHVRNV